MPNALLFEAFKGRMPAEGHFPRTQGARVSVSSCGRHSIAGGFQWKKETPIVCARFSW